VLRHERVELFLVLGVAQAIEEIAEFDLFFLKAPQRLHAVVVEGAVAARGRAETKSTALHAAAHPLHLVLHALHFILETIVAPATHFPAPDCVEENGESDRPPEHEAEHGENNPAGMPGRSQHRRLAKIVG